VPLRLTRRELLRHSATALALAPIAGPVASLNRIFDAPRTNSLSSGSSAPIDTIVILCQENRSMDHYLGFLSALSPSSRRPALGNQLPDTQGQTWDPYHDNTQCGFDPNHEWDASHAKWDTGKMDGFVLTDSGSWPMAYYDASDHPYHVDLAQAFGLCDMHFCSLIGPTTPNRMFLWSGTHGGIRVNPDPAKPASLQVVNWPTITDNLDAKGVTWGCYAVADGNVPSPIGAFNPLVFFQKHIAPPDQRVFFDISTFLAQAAAGTLPNVSWIITEAVVSEHPPAPPDMGQALVARVLQALMGGPKWSSTALFLTYDEGGGFWDHVAPTILELDTPADHPWSTALNKGTLLTTFADDGQEVGPAFRVPLIAVSPWVKQGTIFSSPADHTSVLRFLEWRFGLDPLVTIAPGRRVGLSDLVSLFDFTQTSPDTSSRGLPTVVDISAALTQCPVAIPEWLPPLIGPVVVPFPQPTPSATLGGPEAGAAAAGAGLAAVGLAAVVRSHVRAARRVQGLAEIAQNVPPPGESRQNPIEE
jgi:phospholipase C